MHPPPTRHHRHTQVLRGSLGQLQCHATCERIAPWGKQLERFDPERAERTERHRLHCFWSRLSTVGRARHVTCRPSLR